MLGLAPGQPCVVTCSRPQSDPTAALLRLSMEGVGEAIISPDFFLTITGKSKSAEK
jgi:hypothetical protein